MFFRRLARAGLTAGLILTAGLLLATAVVLHPLPSYIPARFYLSGVSDGDLALERDADARAQQLGSTLSTVPRSGVWQLRAIRAQEAWAAVDERWRGREGRPRVRVGVFDGVLATGHPDLEGNIAPGSEEDWRAMTLGRLLGLGHGTGVMGIIAGAGPPGLTGAAPRARLVSFSTLVLDRDGSMSGALRHFTASGVRVANFAIALPYQITEQSTVDAAYTAGVLPITGLYNRDTSDTAYPAAYERVAVVSSIGPNDRALDLGWGPLLDLVAPGGGLLTTAPMLRVGLIAFGPVYASLCCNSAASALVTGAAALVLESDPTLTSAQVEKRLKISARKTAEMVDGSGRPVHWHPRYGYGAVDAYAAVTLDREGPTTVLDEVTMEGGTRLWLTGSALDGVQDARLDPSRRRDDHLRGVPTSNVARVEYRVGDGSWQPLASGVATQGYQVHFDVTVALDGSPAATRVEVRSWDTAGNAGPPAVFDLGRQ